MQTSGFRVYLTVSLSEISRLVNNALAHAIYYTCKRQDEAFHLRSGPLGGI